MVHRGTFFESNNIWIHGEMIIKVLTALVGQMSLSVGWEIGPEWGLNPCPAEPGYILHLQIV